MNAYEKAVSLGITGTDAEKVAALRALGLTARPIMLADLLNVLNIPLKMLVRLPRADSDGSKWSGTAFNLILWINENGTQEMKDSVNSWFSHITNDRNITFDTTIPTIAAPFWSLAQAFADQPTFPSAADFAAVADLGGGWLFADLTVEAFAAQREAAEAAQLRAEMRTRLDTIWNQIGTSEQADGIADLRVIADELEAA
jgi:hypothetical protein